MKNIKKLLSVLLSLSIFFSFSIPTSAEVLNQSITNPATASDSIYLEDSDFTPLDDDIYEQLFSSGTFDEEKFKQL